MYFSNGFVVFSSYYEQSISLILVGGLVRAETKSFSFTVQPL